MCTAAILLTLCLPACGAPSTQVEPLEAPITAPPVPAAEPEAEPAGPPTTEEAVRQRIEELFTLCKDGEYETAAGYIVNRGEDELRQWKTVHDYSTEESRKAVHGVCNTLNAYLSASDSWQFEDFETEEESEGVWLVQEVAFWKGGQMQTLILAFLEVEGVYALGDID